MDQSPQALLLLPLLGVVFVSLISPGPDFAIVVKNSLVYSRRSALLTALGIAVGLLIHITYTLLGLGVLIVHTPLLLHLVQIIGASYLFYIGYKNLMSKGHFDKISGHHLKQDIPPIQAFKVGFITNAFNPKAMLFFVSLFSVMIPTDISGQVKLILAGIIFIETWLWFSFVAFCLSGKKTRAKFEKMSHWIERLTGCILILLALKLLLSRLA